MRASREKRGHGLCEAPRECEGVVYIKREHVKRWD